VANLVDNAVRRDVSGGWVAITIGTDTGRVVEAPAPTPPTAN
jgi:hypothetical protein